MAKEIYIYIEPNELDTKIYINEENGAVHFRCTMPNTEATVADWAIFDGEGSQRYDSGSETVNSSTNTISFYTTSIGIGVYLLEVSDYISQKGYRCEFELSYDARPSYFQWTIPKESNNRLRISAEEWNAFTKKINDVREFYGLDAVNFTEAKSYKLEGRNVITKKEAEEKNIESNCFITFEIMREAVEAIIGGDNSSGIPSSVSADDMEIIDIKQGQGLSALFLNKIVDVLNEIIKNI